MTFLSPMVDPCHHIRALYDAFNDEDFDRCAAFFAERVISFRPDLTKAGGTPMREMSRGLQITTMRSFRAMHGRLRLISLVERSGLVVAHVSLDRTGGTGANTFQFNAAGLIRRTFFRAIGGRSPDGAFDYGLSTVAEASLNGASGLPLSRRRWTPNPAGGTSAEAPVGRTG